MGRWCARAGGAWPDGGRAQCVPRTAPISAPEPTPPTAAAGPAPGPTSSCPSGGSAPTAGTVRTGENAAAAPDPRGRSRSPAGRTGSRGRCPPTWPPSWPRPPDPDWSYLRERVTERMAAGIGRLRARAVPGRLSHPQDRGRRWCPRPPSARELLGLSHYHQGYWKAGTDQPRGLRRPHRLGRPAPGAHGLPAGARAAEAGRGPLLGAAAGVTRSGGPVRGTAGAGRDPRRPG